MLICPSMTQLAEQAKAQGLSYKIMTNMDQSHVILIHNGGVFLSETTVAAGASVTDALVGLLDPGIPVMVYANNMLPAQSKLAKIAVEALELLTAYAEGKWSPGWLDKVRELLARRIK